MTDVIEAFKILAFMAALVVTLGASLACALWLLRLVLG
jgi:hypothetical protein